MKKDFNHIEDIFKEAFDNFESNVDPSVWNNIQTNISGVNGVSSIASSTVGAASTKVIFIKVLAGILVLAGLGTGTYLLLKDNSSEVLNKATLENNLKIEKNGAIIRTDDAETINSTTEETISYEETTKRSRVDNVVVTTVAKDFDVKNKVDKGYENSEVKTTNEDGSTANQSNNPSERPNTQDKNRNSERPVIEQDNLNIKIKTSTLIGKAPLDVEFNVEGNAVAYSWDFGDGSEITSQINSFHTYVTPGKYLVKLTGLDKNANTKTVSQIVMVEKNITSSISVVPTVFSPNADGINDVIKIDGENIKTFNAVIRDANGNLVFEWNSLEGFWDGRDLNNQILPKGGYYIVIQAIGEDGEKHLVRQKIQLF